MVDRSGADLDGGLRGDFTRDRVLEEVVFTSRGGGSAPFVAPEFDAAFDGGEHAVGRVEGSEGVESEIVGGRGLLAEDECPPGECVHEDIEPTAC